MEEGNAGSALGLIDIHARLVNWFLWGFIIALSPFAIACMTWLISKANTGVAFLVGNITACAVGCGSLAWWILGIVYRFDSTGRYSIGEITPKDTDKDVWLEQ